ncbi:hypothetical protein GCM10010415_25630 [Streptomyces atrovirens]
MPEELPAWWTWSIRSTQWYFCRATRVEAAQLAGVREGRLQLGQRVGRRAGPQVLVPVEDQPPVAVPHRDDGPLEASFLPGRGGPLMSGAGRNNRRPGAGFSGVTPVAASLPLWFSAGSVLRKTAEGTAVSLVLTAWRPA